MPDEFLILQTIPHIIVTYVNLFNTIYIKIFFLLQALFLGFKQTKYNNYRRPKLLYAGLTQPYGNITMQIDFPFLKIYF
jgi:hypothetical protein